MTFHSEGLIKVVRHSRLWRKQKSAQLSMRGREADRKWLNYDWAVTKATTFYYRVLHANYSKPWQGIHDYRSINGMKLKSPATISRLRLDVFSTAFQPAISIFTLLERAKYRECCFTHINIHHRISRSAFADLLSGSLSKLTIMMALARGLPGGERKKFWAAQKAAIVI